MSRVLVVEDESAIAELVSSNLRHAGYEVTVTADSAEAQRVVDGVPPDLPLIMRIARADEADKIAGLDSGADDDYLTKPFSPQELLVRVRAVLRRRAPEALDSAGRPARRA